MRCCCTVLLIWIDCSARIGGSKITILLVERETSPYFTNDGLTIYGRLSIQIIFHILLLFELTALLKVMT